MKTWLSALALIAAFANPGVNALAQTAPTAAGADWPQANSDYANTRAAVNTSISSANVRQLGVAWTIAVTGTSIFGALATNCGRRNSPRRPRRASINN
jgi:glucose dehydrogenase